MIQEALSQPTLFIRAYGEGLSSLAEDANQIGIQLCQAEGLRETEAMLLDVSGMAARGFSQVLLITAHAPALKPHLTQLQQSLPQLTISVATKLVNMQIMSVAELPAAEYQFVVKKPAGHSGFSSQSPSASGSKLHPPSESVPLFQNLQGKRGQEHMHGVFIMALAELAEAGQLVTEFSQAIKMFQQRAKLPYEVTVKWLRSGEGIGLFLITERQFGSLLNVSYVSLKLEHMSLQGLLWVLRSLKHDEMIPTERAIQSRMKEVFDYKPTALQWSNLLQAAKRRDRHSHSLSAPDSSVFRSSDASSPHRVPMFIVSSTTDPISATETCVIYPEGERWLPLDQYCKSGDVLGVKQQAEWGELMKFLEDYFTGPTRRAPTTDIVGYFAGDRLDKHRASKSEEDSRAVPGGRYGFAQFLKVCGSERLQECSLGKLSYMVQLAINEDLLRYHRTLLVWTPSSRKLTDKETSGKLTAIKRAVVQLLLESKTGVSLAQLPLHLKRALGFPFELTELGYAKLKDLLMTIPEVKIELRGTNHPFAVYKEDSYRRPTDVDADKLCGVLSGLLRGSRFGLSSGRAEDLLTSCLGVSVDWRMYNCSNILEFVTQWGNGAFEVAKVGDSLHILSALSSCPGDRSAPHFFESPISCFESPNSKLGSPNREDMQSLLTTSYHSQASSSEIYNPSGVYYKAVSSFPIDFEDSSNDYSREEEERQRRFIETLLSEGTDEPTSTESSRTEDPWSKTTNPKRLHGTAIENPWGRSRATAGLNASQPKTHRGLISWGDQVPPPPPGF
jgi:hypothetical protein